MEGWIDGAVRKHEAIWNFPLSWCGASYPAIAPVVLTSLRGCPSFGYLVHRFLIVYCSDRGVARALYLRS